MTNMTVENNNNKVLNVPALRFPEFTEEWESVLLEDVAEFQKKRISSDLLNNSNYISTENILQNFGGVQNSISIPANTNVIEYQKGDVLLSNIRPYLKKVWLSDRHGGCSADVFVLRGNQCERRFLYYVIASDRFINFVMSGAKGVKMPRGDKSQMEKFAFFIPTNVEQKKIARFLSMLDERIRLQNKIIEKLETLIKGIVELAFSHAATSNTLGCYITQISQRNKTGKDLPVLSVSNKHGFVEQSEQFEDRIIASDDTSNYKIVDINDFAYNPARINVGSIARLKDKECGIVSPMYICFRTSKDILPEYLELFFKTVTFSFEVGKRLEGSVRLCLSYESLCEIVIPIISIREQQSLVKMVTTFHSKLDVEKGFLSSYQSQKQCLLSQMFI